MGFVLLSTVFAAVDGRVARPGHANIAEINRCHMRQTHMTLTVPTDSHTR